jgi:hypothetical protein
LKISKKQLTILRESSIVFGCIGFGIVAGISAIRYPALLNLVLGFAGLGILYMFGYFVVSFANKFEVLVEVLDKKVDKTPKV